MKKLNIQYCSDLHLEFEENLYYMQENPLIPKADILILAGDIMTFLLMHKPSNLLDFVSDNFEATYWIPGNHEYYRSDLADVKTPLYEEIRKNVFLLNNQTIVYKNVEMVFSTLWSHIPPQNEWAVQQSVNDFSLIKNEGRNFTATDFNALHKKDYNFLKTALSQQTDKQRIVVTHHVPTKMHYPEQYINSNINCAFAVELHDFIERSNVSYWIYGHHHFNIPKFKIGNTTMLTNQLGYVQREEHKGFKRNAVIEF